jgi:hypothetical protein
MEETNAGHPIRMAASVSHSMRELCPALLNKTYFN